jgi:hypothetical protein
MASLSFGNDRVGQPLVFMTKNVSDSHDLPPGDFRPLGLQTQGNTPHRFGNNLDRALNYVAQLPVCGEFLQRLSRRHDLDALYRLEDVVKDGREIPFH